MPSTLPPELDAHLTECSAGFGTLPFDARRYEAYLDGLDLTEKQRSEVLQILWWTMSAFVDIGFGVDSVGLSLPQPKDGPAETDAAAEQPPCSIAEQL